MAFSSSSADSTATSSSKSSRVNTYSEAEPVPFLRGYGIVAPKWITDRFNDEWSSGSTTGQAYCSVVGIVCYGVVKKVRGFYCGGERYAIFDQVRPDDSSDANYYSFDFSFGNDKLLGPTWKGRFYWGREDQPIDTDLEALHGQSHPAYRGYAYAIMWRVHCGQVQAQSEAKPAIPNISFGVICDPSDTMPSGLRIPSSLSDNEFRGVNYIAGIYDVLTHPRGGMGFSASKLNVDDMITKAQAMEAGTKTVGGLSGADVRFSPLITGDTQGDSFIKDALEYFDGWSYVKGGKLMFDWFASDGSIPDDDTIPTISDKDFTEPPKIKTSTLEEQPTKIVVSGLEGDSGDLDLADASETADVPLIRELTGDLSTKKIDRKFTTSRDVLARIAALEARKSVVPDMEGEGTLKLNSSVNIDGSQMRPSDVFALQWAVSGVRHYCRVTERLEKDTSVEIRFKRERGLCALPAQAVGSGRGDTITTAPTAPTASQWSVIQSPNDKNKVQLWTNLPAGVAGAQLYFRDLSDSAYEFTKSFTDVNGGVVTFTIKFSRGVGYTVTFALVGDGVSSYGIKVCPWTVREAYTGDDIYESGNGFLTTGGGYKFSEATTKFEYQFVPSENGTIKSIETTDEVVGVTIVAFSYLGFNPGGAGGESCEAVNMTSEWTLLGTQSAGIGGTLASAVALTSYRTQLNVTGYTQALLTQTTGLTEADLTNGTMLAMCDGLQMGVGPATITAEGVASLAIVQYNAVMTGYSDVPIFFRRSAEVVDYSHSKFYKNGTFLFRLIAYNAIGETAAVDEKSVTLTYISANSSASSSDAYKIGYYNGDSGLTATNAQKAIDEIDGKVDTHGVSIAALQEVLGSSNYTSAIEALDTRMDAAETTLADHETRIDALEAGSGSSNTSSGRGLYSYLWSLPVATLASIGFTTKSYWAYTKMRNSRDGLVISNLEKSYPHSWMRKAKALSGCHCVTALVTVNAATYSSAGYIGFWGYGISGEMKHYIALYPYPDTLAIKVQKALLYNDPSTNATFKFAGSTVALRICDDGTNVAFLASVDGENWALIYSIDKASGYLGSTGYTQLLAGVSYQASLTIHSWEEKNWVSWVSSGLVATSTNPTDAFYYNDWGRGAVMLLQDSSTFPSWYKAKPGTAFTTTIKVALSAYVTDQWAWLGVKIASTGETIAVAVCGDGTIHAKYFTLNTLTADYVVATLSDQAALPEKEVYLRIQGVQNYTYGVAIVHLFYSVDGTTWHPALTTQNAAYTWYLDAGTSLSGPAFAFDQIAVGLGSSSAVSMQACITEYADVVTTA